MKNQIKFLIGLPRGTSEERAGDTREVEGQQGTSVVPRRRLSLSNLKMKVMLTVLALFICEQAGLFATFLTTVV